MNISVTNSLSLRLFYSGNASISHGTTRNNELTGTLSMADASALRNAIRKLQDYKFEDASETLIQEKLKAFTDTINNTVTSAAKYGASDTSVKNAVSKLKRLNNDYASELQKLVLQSTKMAQCHYMKMQLKPTLQRRLIASLTRIQNTLMTYMM